MLRCERGVPGWSDQKIDCMANWEGSPAMPASEGLKLFKFESP